MTPPIAAVESECRKAIELGEKCSHPWVIDSHAVPGELSISDRDEVIVCTATNEFSRDMPAQREAQRNDISFIAHSRTFSPAAAKALLASIDGHEKVIVWARGILAITWQYDGDGGAHGAAQDIIDTATEALRAIALSFPI